MAFKDFKNAFVSSGEHTARIVRIYEPDVNVAAIDLVVEAPGEAFDQQRLIQRYYLSKQWQAEKFVRECKSFGINDPATLDIPEIRESLVGRIVKIKVDVVDKDSRSYTNVTILPTNDTKEEVINPQRETHLYGRDMEDPRLYNF